MKQRKTWLCHVLVASDGNYMHLHFYTNFKLTHGSSINLNFLAVLIFQLIIVNKHEYAAY